MFLLLSACAVAEAREPVQSDYHTLFPAREEIEAVGYDSHVELRWRPVEGARDYAVYVVSGKDLLFRGRTPHPYYLDFTADLGRNAVYTFRVRAFGPGGELLAQTPEVSAEVSDFTDEQLLEMVQRYTFRYFWEFADPFSGMAYERSNDTRADCVTVGGTGFGLMGIVAAVENGFVTRDRALERFEKIVGSLERLPRYHGAWAHWYDSRNGKAYPFSEKDDGGDLVETAFLVQGLLSVNGFLDGTDPREKRLAERIGKLWREVEWNHYTRGEEALYWHWSPAHGFGMNHRIRGYDETLITYVLAAASPTYPISRSVYDRCWVNPEPGEFFCVSDFYGIMLPLGKRAQMGGPLFWVHYSYMGLDPRGLSDAYADYWEQNRRYTLIDRAYCIDNPYNWTGYGPGFWGLTACDALPSGYRVHAPGAGHDTGTVAPTAALSSMPYTPGESMEVLKNLYRNYGRIAFGMMGFYDAVNLTLGGGCSTESYLAIDQGPILVMIENYRSAALWDAFMRNDDVRRGLDRLGFRIGHKAIEYRDR